MNKLVIVEGAQCAGKTTATNWLREQMPSTNLIRLSGVKDKSMNGSVKAFKYHEMFVHAIQMTHDCDVNYVLDRSFITEYVYSKLGYKPYDWEYNFGILMDRLNELTNVYDVHIIILQAVNLQVLSDRLYNRHEHDHKHKYQPYMFESSVAQQNEYVQLADILATTFPNIHNHIIDSTADGWLNELEGLITD